jgi:hypothetical protein
MLPMPHWAIFVVGMYVGAAAVRTGHPTRYILKRGIDEIEKVRGVGSWHIKLLTTAECDQRLYWRLRAVLRSVVREILQPLLQPLPS